MYQTSKENMAPKKNKKVAFDKTTNSYPYITTATWRFLPNTINLLVQQREEAKADKNVYQGLNYTIILLSACYFEGVLTSALRQILVFSEKSKRKGDKPIFNHLERMVLRSDGIDKFNEVSFLILNKEIFSLMSDKEREGIKILFQIRNIIAHGKEITHYMTPMIEGDGVVHFPPNPEMFWGDGSGEKIESFLVKRKLIKKSKRPSPQDFFVDAVSDYFWKLAQDAIRSISNKLDHNQKVSFDFAADLITEQDSVPPSWIKKP